jgi:hypothetical protein
MVGCLLALLEQLTGMDYIMSIPETVLETENDSIWRLIIGEIIVFSCFVFFLVFSRTT